MEEDGGNAQRQWQKTTRRRRRRRGLVHIAPVGLSRWCVVWSSMIVLLVPPPSWTSGSGREGLVVLNFAWAASASGTAGPSPDDAHVAASSHNNNKPHNSSSSTSSYYIGGVPDSTSSYPSSPRSRSATTTTTTTTTTRQFGTSTVFSPMSATAATSLPCTLGLKPPGASSTPSSLAARYAGILGIIDHSPVPDDIDTGRKSLSHDFLQRLRHEEEEERESKRQQSHSQSLSFATAPNSSLLPRQPFSSSLWSQTLSSSLLLVLASVLLELDWNQLSHELHRASVVAVSILWLPWFWIRPDQWQWSDAYVYLPLLLRPSIVSHLWHTVLVPYTGPTLCKMMVAEVWSMVWKTALLPLLPRFPKHTDTWHDAVWVVLGQALHKGTLKLFTSRVQQHLQSACVVLWNKGMERLVHWSVWIVHAQSNLWGTP